MAYTECNYCGKTVKKNATTLRRLNGVGYCGMACYHAKLKERFIEHTAICLQCGDEFKIYPSDVELNRGKLCSKECKDIWQRGERHPRHISRIKKICKQCHKEFFVERYRLNDARSNRGIFCTIDCRLKYQVKDHHPRWIKVVDKRDVDTRMHVALRRWRKEVLERDGYKCVICGSQKNLHVDHIQSFALYPALRADINNGRTLCIECHKETPTWGVQSQYQ